MTDFEDQARSRAHGRASTDLDPNYFTSPATGAVTTPVSPDAPPWETPTWVTDNVLEQQKARTPLNRGIAEAARDQGLLTETEYEYASSVYEDAPRRNRFERVLQYSEHRGKLQNTVGLLETMSGFRFLVAASAAVVEGLKMDKGDHEGFWQDSNVWGARTFGQIGGFGLAWSTEEWKKRVHGRTMYRDVLLKGGFEDDGWLMTAGLGMDILLDPATYLTFGVGAATKVSMSGGSKAALHLSRNVGHFAGKKAAARAARGGELTLTRWGELVMKEGARDYLKQNVKRMYKKQGIKNPDNITAENIGRMLDDTAERGKLTEFIVENYEKYGGRALDMQRNVKSRFNPFLWPRKALGKWSMNGLVHRAKFTQGPAAMFQETAGVFGKEGTWGMVGAGLAGSAGAHIAGIPGAVVGAQVGGAIGHLLTPALKHGQVTGSVMKILDRGIDRADGLTQEMITRRMTPPGLLAATKLTSWGLSKTHGGVEGFRNFFTSGVERLPGEERFYVQSIIDHTEHEVAERIVAVRNHFNQKIAVPNITGKPKMRRMSSDERIKLSHHLEKPDMNPIPKWMEPAAKFVKGQFDEIYRLEDELYIAGNKLDDYVTHIYSSGMFRKMLNWFKLERKGANIGQDFERLETFHNSQTNPFALHRKIATLDDALALGKDVELDIANILTARWRISTRMRGKKAMTYYLWERGALGGMVDSLIMEHAGFRKLLRKIGYYRDHVDTGAPGNATRVQYSRLDQLAAEIAEHDLKTLARRARETVEGKKGRREGGLARASAGTKRPIPKPVREGSSETRVVERGDRLVQETVDLPPLKSAGEVTESKEWFQRVPDKKELKEIRRGDKIVKETAGQTKFYKTTEHNKTLLRKLAKKGLGVDYDTMTTGEAQFLLDFLAAYIKPGSLFSARTGKFIPGKWMHPDSMVMARFQYGKYRPEGQHFGEQELVRERAFPTRIPDSHHIEPSGVYADLPSELDIAKNLGDESAKMEKYFHDNWIDPNDAVLNKAKGTFELPEDSWNIYKSIRDGKSDFDTTVFKDSLQKHDVERALEWGPGGAGPVVVKREGLGSGAEDAKGLVEEYRAYELSVHQGHETFEEFVTEPKSFGDWFFDKFGYKPLDTPPKNQAGGVDVDIGAAKLALAYVVDMKKAKDNLGTWMTESADGFWHVTTANSRVVKEGLRTQRQTRTAGFGPYASDLDLSYNAGYNIDEISATTQRSHAEIMQRRLRLHILSARGEATPTMVFDHFVDSAGGEITAARGTLTTRSQDSTGVAASVIDELGIPYHTTVVPSDDAILSYFRGMSPDELRQTVTRDILHQVPDAAHLTAGIPLSGKQLFEMSAEEFASKYRGTIEGNALNWARGMRESAELVIEPARANIRHFHFDGYKMANEVPPKQVPGYEGTGGKIVAGGSAEEILSHSSFPAGIPGGLQKMRSLVEDYQEKIAWKKDKDLFDVVASLDRHVGDATHYRADGKLVEAEYPIGIGMMAPKAKLAQLDPNELSIVRLAVKGGTQPKGVGMVSEVRLPPKSFVVKETFALPEQRRLVPIGDKVYNVHPSMGPRVARDILKRRHADVKAEFAALEKGADGRYVDPESAKTLLDEVDRTAPKGYRNKYTDKQVQEVFDESVGPRMGTVEVHRHFDSERDVLAGRIKDNTKESKRLRQSARNILSQNPKAKGAHAKAEKLSKELGKLDEVSVKAGEKIRALVEAERKALGSVNKALAKKHDSLPGTARQAADDAKRLDYARIGLRQEEEALARFEARVKEGTDIQSLGYQGGAKFRNKMDYESAVENAKLKIESAEAKLAKSTEKLDKLNKAIENLNKKIIDTKTKSQAKIKSHAADSGKAAQRAAQVKREIIDLTPDAAIDKARIDKARAGRAKSATADRLEIELARREARPSNLVDLDGTYMMPKSFADAIDQALSSGFDMSNKVHRAMKHYQAFQKLWKVPLTLPFAGYWGRNTVTNVGMTANAVGFNMLDPRNALPVFNTVGHLLFRQQGPVMDALGKAVPKQVKKAFKKKFEEAKKAWGDVELTTDYGDKVSVRELTEEIVKRGVNHGFVYSELAHEPFRRLDGVAHGWMVPSVSDLARTIKQKVYGATMVGETLTDVPFRVTLFTQEVLRGKSYAEAAESVKKYLNDYARLSPQEQVFMRTVIPFYSWTQFSLESAFKLSYEQPGKFIMPFKAANEISAHLTADHPPDYAPAWINDRLGIWAGPNEHGYHDRIQGFAFNQEEALRQVWAAQSFANLILNFGTKAPIIGGAIQNVFQPSANPDEIDEAPLRVLAQMDFLGKAVLEGIANQEFFSGSPIYGDKLMNQGSRLEAGRGFSRLDDPEGVLEAVWSKGIGGSWLKSFLEYTETTEGGAKRARIDPMKRWIVGNSPVSRFVAHYEKHVKAKKPGEVNYMKEAGAVLGITLYRYHEKEGRYYRDKKRQRAVMSLYRAAHLLDTGQYTIKRNIPGVTDVETLAPIEEIQKVIDEER